MTVAEECAERSEMLSQWVWSVAATPSLWRHKSPSEVLADIFISGSSAKVLDVDELSGRPLANGQT